VSGEEICKVLHIYFYSPGVVVYPKRKNWPGELDLGVKAVSKATSTNRYHDTQKLLPFADKQNLSNEANILALWHAESKYYTVWLISRAFDGGRIYGTQF